MINYNIVQGSSMSNLVDEVNSWLNEGWICQGGVFTIGQRYQQEYWAQAMIKCENKNEMKEYMGGLFDESL
jgi:hypothetical protein